MINNILKIGYLRPDAAQLHSASFQSKGQGISLFLWLFCSAGMKQEGEDNTTSAQSTIHPQITVLTAKHTHTQTQEWSRARRSIFTLVQLKPGTVPWIPSMHFSLSVVRFQLFGHLLFLLVTIKAESHPDIFFFFCSPPKRLPVLNCLLSFISWGMLGKRVASFQTLPSRELATTALAGSGSLLSASAFIRPQSPSLESDPLSRTQANQNLLGK